MSFTNAQKHLWVGNKKYTQIKMEHYSRTEQVVSPNANRWSLRNRLYLKITVKLHWLGVGCWRLNSHRLYFSVKKNLYPSATFPTSTQTCAHTQILLCTGFSLSFYHWRKQFIERISVTWLPEHFCTLSNWTFSHKLFLNFLSSL